MQNASIEQLSRIISEPRPDDSSGKNKRLLPRNPLSQIHLSLAEGWFSLFLLAVVVYSTIWCVQAADWVANLNILTLTTALGLIIGVIAAKQRRLSRWLVHPLAVVLGVLLAFWQTAQADYAGNTAQFMNGIHQWFVLALNGGTSTDDSIFLFLITGLSFLLAYASAWLLYRTRSPWLMIFANAFVLLINLSNIQPGYIVFLVVFLVASLLLLLRFNLYESSIRWRRLGLRCSDDLGWEFMQAGAIVSIGLLIFAWLLPWGYINDAAYQIWSVDNNPWVQVENLWNRLVSVNGSYNALNHGNFTNTLTLGGNPNLSDAVVFTVKTDDGTQYLASISYDTYTGRDWTNGATDGISNASGAPIYDGSQDLRAIQQTFTVVNPPGEDAPYLFGASQIATVDQSANIVYRKSDGSVVAWLRTNGALAAGDHYTVNSYISGADIKTLESIPLPADAPSYTPNPYSPDESPPVGYYSPAILKSYLQVPPGLDVNIKNLAQRITAPYKTMYDKASALENYLRENYAYNINVKVPSGEEPISWFLFRGRQGYCNYFAAAMAIMAREVGIPARVVAGYTNGKYDAKTHQWVVRGTDAHAWTQVYFAGFGWVNFEPTASFSTFTRPVSSSNSSNTVTPGGTSLPGGNGKGKRPVLPDEPGNGLSNVSNTSPDTAAQLPRDIGLFLFGLLGLLVLGVIVFALWWRRLFKGYDLPVQIFGRVSLLASWAGITMRRSQTPYEYAGALAKAAPEQAVTIERLADIYVRDRWADPSSEIHPKRSGEVAELPRLWQVLQPRLFLYALRHPYFLRRIPAAMKKLMPIRRRKRRDESIQVDSNWVE